METLYILMGAKRVVLGINEIVKVKHIPQTWHNISTLWIRCQSVPSWHYLCSIIFSSEQYVFRGQKVQKRKTLLLTELPLALCLFLPLSSSALLWWRWKRSVSWRSTPPNSWSMLYSELLHSSRTASENPWLLPFLGEFGLTLLAKSIPECVTVWLPRTWSSFHFHPHSRAWPQMLTKLVGGWLPLLVSVHSFHVGSEVSFQCLPDAHSEKPPCPMTWPQTKNVFPRCPCSWTSHFGSKPLNTATAWIKYEFIPLPWIRWSTEGNFLLLSRICKSFRHISCLQMFHLEHWP